MECCVPNHVESDLVSCYLNQLTLTLQICNRTALVIQVLDTIHIKFAYKKGEFGLILAVKAPLV